MEEKPCLPCDRKRRNITKTVKKKYVNRFKCYYINTYQQKQMYLYLNKGFIKANALLDIIAIHLLCEKTSLILL